jgi:amidase/aspartyl-tRNA(Asn)/glutamyl-tRNA(Gln) amidotransferase subunit A
MSVIDELAYTTTTELAGRIRRRELSPVEVMDATIARIEARNPSLTAFVHTAFEEARTAARAAEHALTDGTEVGPLHGVPTAIKDLFDFKPGWPATFGGIPSLRDYTVPAYCVWAERMEAAGAILVGKTNSPVMGFRGVTDNPLFGPTRNPFDTTRNAGGSSGGGAAAVADGLLTFAEGTDGGGSVRIPAAWCGVYGYKQSWGRVPVVTRPNAFGATDPFIFEGMLTRTVADAALGLSVLAGPDPRDPYVLDAPFDATGVCDRSIEGMRIAYSPDLGVFPVDRRVAAVVAEAVRAFEAAGAHVEEVSIDIPYDQRELGDLWCRMIAPLSVIGFDGFKAQGYDLLGELPPEFLEWLEIAERLTIRDLARDQVMRSTVFDALQGVLAGHDLLVSPTLACLPVENGTDGNTLGPAEVEGVEVNRLIGWCMTYFANFTGHPAASVPAGLADGLPVGMHVMGRRGADADVLAASAAFERVRPWAGAYEIPANRAL